MHTPPSKVLRPALKKCKPYLSCCSFEISYTLQLQCFCSQTPGLNKLTNLAGFREVSVEELKQQLDTAPDDLFVLDVRTAWEFARGHLPGATNIDMEALSDKVAFDRHDILLQQAFLLVGLAGSLAIFFTEYLT